MGAWRKRRNFFLCAYRRALWTGPLIPAARDAAMLVGLVVVVLAPIPRAGDYYAINLIYGLPLHCKIVSVFGIRVGLLKYIRPLMHPSVRALMTFARRSLTKAALINKGNNLIIEPSRLA